MNALESVAAQELNRSIELEVIVVDNDKFASAEAICTRFRAAHPLVRLSYVQELTSGVSYARNRCLREASGKWIAFLDDDEVASPRWLIELHSTASAHHADAVFGPVLAKFCGPTPDWLRASRTHERARFASGTRIGWRDARTGNVLLNRELIKTAGEFDYRFAKTGGEDSFFFACALRSGARLVWCDEAEVHESVPLQRMTKRWLLQRAFYGGSTFTRLNVAIYGRHVYIVWAIHGAGMLLIYAFPALFSFILGRPKWIFYVQKMVGAVGKLIAPFSKFTVYGQK
ncbi:hypothetical protein LMG23994_01432 [Cupriavidus pinatubonensis]|uniref:Glycosyltransferase 2-like domain-containing protein n=2 Tax=Cupriavidus pinatubonensis TaxID=248026 RepID=A0ABM8WN39_9BURK|nr:hypothetical protein LMG23994_01432 [Cupriavidus pinatubonensis]